MPETLVGKYMIATIDPPELRKKTRTYTVSEKASGGVLASIGWYGAWRCFCFFPAPDAVFDSGCAKQIAEWLDELNAAYKRSKEVNNG